jgi:hypothetical protein
MVSAYGIPIAFTKCILATDDAAKSAADVRKILEKSLAGAAIDPDSAKVLALQKCMDLGWTRLEKAIASLVSVEHLHTFFGERMHLVDPVRDRLLLHRRPHEIRIKLADVCAPDAPALDAVDAFLSGNFVRALINLDDGSGKGFSGALAILGRHRAVPPGRFKAWKIALESALMHEHDTEARVCLDELLEAFMRLFGSALPDSVLGYCTTVRACKRLVGMGLTPSEDVLAGHIGDTLTHRTDVVDFLREV